MRKVVESSVPFRDPGDQPGVATDVAKVGLERLVTVTGEPRDHLVDSGVDVERAHRGAGVGECVRYGPTDAAGGPSNEDDCTVQSLAAAPRHWCHLPIAARLPIVLDDCVRRQ